MAYFLEMSLDEPVASKVPTFATAKQTGTGFQQERAFRIAMPKAAPTKTSVMSDEERARLAQELMMRRQAQTTGMRGSDAEVSLEPLKVEEPAKIFGLDRNVVIFGGIGAALLGVVLLKKSGMLGERMGPPPGVRMPSKTMKCGKIKRAYDGAVTDASKRRLLQQARSMRCAWPGR